MKVYGVIFDWSTSDDSLVEIELFDTYQKAFARFNEIIANEKKPEISWVADAFDENGNVSDGYEFDENGLETDEWTEGAVSQAIREYIESNQDYPDDEAMKSIYSSIDGSEEGTRIAQFLRHFKHFFAKFAF